jgi:cob(I)alamin adenosyltransferase
MTAKIKNGLLILNTGKGKGKTTAALGLVMRAWGRGFRICFIQFIKAGTGTWGEVTAAEKMGIEWHASGDGFTQRSRDIQQTTSRALQGWELARQKITSGDYDLIVLDEFTYLFKYGWLDTHEVIEWLRAHRPQSLHMVITGRDAPLELVEYADLVTEMIEIKHPLKQGIKAQPGIEF